ncbi:amidase signature domain-containing protein [Aspergillus desertorum]
MTKSVTRQADWGSLVVGKRTQLDAQIPLEWRLSENARASVPANGHLITADIVRHTGILSENELDITENYSAVELLPSAKGRLLHSSWYTSCLTEHFFQKAIERARYLDEYLQREKEVGIQSTVGYVSFLEHEPASRNSALVEMLLDLGAVPYVKTNIPQTIMTGDSENNIFGRTLNPHNTHLTAGGSSGGEGALVAFRGSILGIGTDIAGSIRIPSLCCGVYGFKPSIDRIPWGGQVADLAMEGIPGLKPSAGPLARNLEDSRDFPLHPPVRRALESAINALGQRDLAYASRLAFQYFICGPHIDHIEPSGEPQVASVAKMSSPMFTGPFPVDMNLGPFEKITPGAQNTAVPHDTFGWPPYTVVWNLLDYPACIIPYGKASRELDPEVMVIDDGVQPSYDPNAVDGAPCVIQVITPRFRDEECLRAARIIDRDIR